jgi:hypothetical protein
VIFQKKGCLSAKDMPANLTFLREEEFGGITLGPVEIAIDPHLPCWIEPLGAPFS